MATEQPQPPAAAGQSHESRRQEDRTLVIKGGKICFGLAAIDCTILDVSPHGARVRTDVVIALPEFVILRFNGGSVFACRVQWARGTEAGFAFEQPEPLIDATAASAARSALAALPADDLRAAIGTLRSMRFFDDPALAKAAEDAETAYLRFKASLQARIGHSGP